MFLGHTDHPNNPAHVVCDVKLEERSWLSSTPHGCHLEASEKCNLVKGCFCPDYCYVTCLGIRTVPRARSTAILLIKLVTNKAKLKENTIIWCELWLTLSTLGTNSWGLTISAPFALKGWWAACQAEGWFPSWCLRVSQAVPASKRQRMSFHRHWWTLRAKKERKTHENLQNVKDF